MKKILVSDFDNTLYINKNISEENQKAILDFQEKDLFIIATGRSKLSFMRNKFIKNNIIKPDYLITSYGTVIIKNNDIIFNTTISKKDKTTCLKIARKYAKDEDILFTSDKENIEDSIVSIKPKDVNKIRIYTKNEQERDIIINCINKELKNDVCCYKITAFGKLAIEIHPANVNKAKAIDLIAKKEHILQEDIYTIGDSENDLDMIKKYKGFAVKNANDIIKKNTINEVENVANLINLIKRSEEYYE